jgi:hypothetical protein
VAEICQLELLRDEGSSNLSSSSSVRVKVVNRAFAMDENADVLFYSVVSDRLTSEGWWTPSTFLGVAQSQCSYLPRRSWRRVMNEHMCTMKSGFLVLLIFGT